MIPRRKKLGEKEDIYLILIKLFTGAFILTATIFTTLIILYPKTFTKQIKKTEIMEKEFIVFYEHTDYGYYTTTVDGKDIVEALNYFSEKHAYKEIYGIMEKK